MSDVDEKNITVELSYKEASLILFAMALCRQRLKRRPVPASRMWMQVLNSIIAKMREANAAALEGEQPTKESR